MSFDLTNKNIQDTFQNLLQQTGSTGEVYDLEGNQVTNININTISSSAVTASVIEIPNGDNVTGNKLHARDGDLFFGNTNLGGSGGGGGLSSLVQDSTPQLGGDLDLNGNNISGSGTIQSTGDISTGGNLNILNNKKLQIDGGDTFVQLSDNTIQIDGDNQVNLSGDIHIKFNAPTIKVEGDISSSNAITSSKVLVNAPNATDDFFLLKSGSLNSLKVNGEGVLQLGAFSFQPTPVKGGIYYDDNQDEFYAGKQN